MVGGHLTDTPSSMNYVSVLSRDSVRPELLIVALNYLDILAGETQNSYLNAPKKQKAHFYAGD